MCLLKICLIQKTVYSATDSVNWILLDDLKSGPKFANSGIAAICSKVVVF